MNVFGRTILAVMLLTVALVVVQIGINLDALTQDDMTFVANVMVVAGVLFVLFGGGWD